MRFLMLASLIFMPCFARSAEPQTLTIKVPAADAKVWVYQNDYWSLPTENDKTIPQNQIVDLKGELKIPLEKKGQSFPNYSIFVRDGSGRIGGKTWSDHPSEKNPNQGLDIPLVEIGNRTGQLLNPEGKPVVGAKIVPAGFSYDSKNERDQSKNFSIPLPPWERWKYSVTSDKDGKFQLPCPGDFELAFHVLSEEYGDSRWIASDKIPLEVRLPKVSTLTITTKYMDISRLKDREITIRLVDEIAKYNQPGIHSMTYLRSKFDDKGIAKFPRIPEGRYWFYLDHETELPGYVEKSDQFIVTNTSATKHTIVFTPAVQAKGVVVSEESGIGLSNVTVHLRISKTETARDWIANHTVKTDDNGRFIVFSRPGWYHAHINYFPEGYVSTTAFHETRAIKIEIPEKGSGEFPPIKLLTARQFLGRVILKDKPVANASVNGSSVDWIRRAEIISSSDGLFTIPNLHPNDTVSPRIRLGKAVNKPEEYPLTNDQKPVVIAIDEANAVTIKGRVMSSDGKPATKVSVRLLHSIQGVGLNKQFGKQKSPEAVMTNAEGRYQFEGYWGGDRYSIKTEGIAYTEGASKELPANVGETITIPDVTVQRKNISMAGIVVDSANNPIVDVELSAVDGSAHKTAQSKADGTFQLTGLAAMPSFIVARKPGYLAQYARFTPGSSDRVSITLWKTESAKSPPYPATANFRTAHDRLHRYLLSQMWSTRSVLNSGGRAMSDMARLDMEQAKIWLEEDKLRKNGKSAFSDSFKSIARDNVIMDIAKDNIDDAIAQYSTLTPTASFDSVHKLGLKLLPIDKAKALKCAEALEEKTQQIVIGSKMYYLARAGDLKNRAGGDGKAMLAEAAELALKLKPEGNTRESMYVGYVASYMAKSDPEKADAIMKLLTDNGDHDRFLSSSIAKVAMVDVPRAKKMLDQFKMSGASYRAEGRIRLAMAIAEKQPDDANTIVNNIDEGPYRVQGLIQLARLWGTTDRVRALAMIDAAFDFMENNKLSFSSWSNFAGRGGCAVIAVVRANELGHPHVQSLIARTLAMLPTTQGSFGRNERDRHVPALAAVLAFIDPATAKHLLASVKSLEQVVSEDTIGDRDWLFAVCLIDPEQGIRLIETLYEHKLKNPNNGSSDGLSELSSVLSAKDPLANLQIWVSLLRELYPDE